MIAGLLRFGILAMVVIMLINIADKLGIHMEWLSLLNDLLSLISNGTRIALVIGAVVVYIFFNFVSEWLQPLGAPNEPQKIVLTTDKTPAQIVGAANRAMLSLVLTFTVTSAAFVRIVVIPAPITLPFNLNPILDPLFDRLIPNPPEVNASSPTTAPSVDKYPATTWPFYSTPTPTTLAYDALTPTVVIIATPTLPPTPIATPEPTPVL